MRYRITDYTIEGQVISFDIPASLGRDLTIEDIRLIIDETQKIVICSSMQKNNVSIVDNTIVVSDKLCELMLTDVLTIELDFGGDAYTMLDELLAIQLETIIGAEDENT